MSALEVQRRAGRLKILQALASAPGATMTAARLNDALRREAAIVVTTLWVVNEIRFLEEMGAVTLSVGSEIAATLTQAGLDHLERASAIAGVDRPSLANVGLSILAEELRNRRV